MITIIVMMVEKMSDYDNNDSNYGWRNEWGFDNNNSNYIRQNEKEQGSSHQAWQSLVLHFPSHNCFGLVSQVLVVTSQSQTP